MLIIDDEQGITRLCSRLLNRAGFRTSAYTDPLQGIAALEQEHFDLMLVDIRMPGMDGFLAIDRARASQPDLAVVVMTGFGTVETAIEALRKGADGLVLKPFAGAELVESLRRALQESQQKRDVLRLQTLRPLFSISETLFAETHPDRLQERLLDAILGHLRCTHAGFYKEKDSSSGYYLVSGRGGELVGEIAASPLVWRAAAWKTPLLVNADGPGVGELQSLLRERKLAACMCALIPQKDARNILLAARSEGEPFFRESDLEIFAILSRQAAAALENARLHTELRLYIRQVEESQRALVLAEKMAIAGRLTASIAHEINNPLQSVRNCLHLAGRKELSQEEQQKYLVLAQTELERLMKTVQRMLDYYRPAALDRQCIDLNDLIKHVLALLERQLAEANVSIQVKLSPRLKPVFAVGDQIQQVLLNLLLNGIQAMPEGGKLIIETVQRKTSAEVTIEDTGPGVPEGERERIFEPFVSTKEDGTGLGLAVSYGIISAHGGSLELVPVRGRGAIFRITLPVGERGDGKNPGR